MRLIRKHDIMQLSFIPRLFPVNCYIIEEEHDLTLIDAALPYSWKAIARTAARLNKPIGRIVLTHAHGDHVGSLDALKQQYEHAEVLISERDAKLLQGDASLLENEPAFPINGSIPQGIRTRADRFIQPGERIGSLEAIPAAGHTPGSFAFMDTRSRALIVGDAFQIRGGIAVSGVMKRAFPFVAMATWHLPTAIESAKRLASISPALLAAGHGVMLERPQALMAKAIAEAEAYLERSSLPFTTSSKA